MNGGQFRWGGDWNGAIKTEQFFDLLAITDNLVQLKVRGSVIKQALEHSVSDNTGGDDIDGKFLSGISGLDFTWDPKL